MTLRRNSIPKKHVFVYSYHVMGSSFTAEVPTHNLSWTPALTLRWPVRHEPCNADSNPRFKVL